MQYTKQAMDFNCQLNILKERGLTIEDEEEAMKFLHSVSYFRFANYLQPMEHNAESHRFAQNSSFTFATNLYIFDRELRSLIFTAIQDIEIAFRTRIIHYFSMEHGPFWFMDASKFKNQSIFNACAHHARIWNRRFPTMPIMPKYLPSQWVITGNFRPNKLYPQLCCLAYLEQSIAAHGSFSKRLLKLIDKSESVNTRSMGFPQEWKNEPLWIIKAYC